MKFSKITFLVLAVVSSYSLQAALPPLWQSVQEFQGLLKDPQLGECVNSSDTILDIKKVSDGFVIMTRERKIKVRVESFSSGRPGPIQFKYHFEKEGARN